MFSPRRPPLSSATNSNSLRIKVHAARGNCLSVAAASTTSVRSGMHQPSTPSAVVSNFFGPRYVLIFIEMHPGRTGRVRNRCVYSGRGSRAIVLLSSECALHVDEQYCFL